MYLVVPIDVLGCPYWCTWLSLLMYLVVPIDVLGCLYWCTWLSLLMFCLMFHYFIFHLFPLILCFSWASLSISIVIFVLFWLFRIMHLCNTYSLVLFLVYLCYFCIVVWSNGKCQQALIHGDDFSTRNRSVWIVICGYNKIIKLIYRFVLMSCPVS